MRVLAHIHTFNDAAIIGRAITAVRAQTRAVDGILVVDNASRDGTLDQPELQQVTVLRHRENRGTSGAVLSGMQFALEQGYDWIWLFDADSHPEPDALEKLLDFFGRLPASERERCFFLACGAVGEAAHPPMVFAEVDGMPAPMPVGEADPHCDCVLWSGTLYRMAAVAKVGLPEADYFADWGELEYGYRGWRCGFTGFLVREAVLRHDVGRRPGMAFREWRLGPLKLLTCEAAPLRCYYFVRNSIYFWLYDCKHRRLRTAAHVILVAIGFTMSFVLRPLRRRRQLIGALRGLRDGLTMHIERRY